jgi:hypothetical protein
MSETFEIKRGDTLPLLKATLWEDAGKTESTDLTNADFVTVKVAVPGQPLVLNRVVTITEPKTAGKVETQLTVTETSIDPKGYSMEFEVTWLNGDISTYPKSGFLSFVVFDDLDPNE